MKPLSFFNQISAAWKQCKADLFRYRIFLLSAFVYLLCTQLIFHKICPIAIITGFPCPGCGITRAFLLLLTGHPALAWKMNPCIYLWIVFFILFFFSRYIKNDQKMLNRAIISAGILSIAVYAVRMFLYYPNRIPYVYNDRSILYTIAVFFGYTP